MINLEELEIVKSFKNATKHMNNTDIHFDVIVDKYTKQYQISDGESMQHNDNNDGDVDMTDVTSGRKSKKRRVDEAFDHLDIILNNMCIIIKKYGPYLTQMFINTTTKEFQNKLDHSLNPKNPYNNHMLLYYKKFRDLIVKAETFFFHYVSNHVEQYLAGFCNILFNDVYALLSQYSQIIGLFNAIEYQHTFSQ